MDIQGHPARRIDTDDAQFLAWTGGSGPPLLLLHGFPQTHLMWREVAPRLVDRFFVVCPDLPGYGGSRAPASQADHAPHSKRAFASRLVGLMARLGHERFSVAGHDRGGRVAYRMALDHPDRIERLAVLDVLPTETAWRLADARFALGFWPWSLLAQDAPLPERILTAAAEAIVKAALGGWGAPGAVFPAEVRGAYAASLADPERAHAICEEYRAAAAIDREHDQADLAAGRRIACPTLVLWSASGPLGAWYEAQGGPLALWRTWAERVEGEPIDAGHFFPEEAPEATVAALQAFMSRDLHGTSLASPAGRHRIWTRACEP